MKIEGMDVFELARRGEVGFLRTLLEKNPEQAQWVKATDKDVDDWTALHYVADASPSLGADVAKVLLEAGADVDAQDEMGRTPLHVAKNAELAKVLIDAGADVHAQDWDGFTALESHEIEGRTDIHDVLLEALREREAKETKQHLEQAVMGQGSKVDGDAEEQVQVQKQRRKM